MDEKIKYYISAPYQTKKGDRRRVILKENGKQLETKKGFKTKKEAGQWATRRIGEIENERLHSALPKTTPMTFFAIAKDYLSHKAKSNDTNTLSGKRTVIRRFLAFLHENHPQGALAGASDISTLFIEEYMAFTSDNKNNKSKKRGSHPWTTKTGNRHKRELSTVFRHAIKKGIVSGDERIRLDISNPCEGAERLKEKKYRRPVPVTDIVALYVLYAKDGIEKDYLEIMCLTNQRGRMIRRFAWEDVDFDRKQATFWHGKGKGDFKPVTVSLGKKALSILKRRFLKRKPDDIYVFTNPKNGERYSRNHDPIRFLFHDIRRRIEESDMVQGEVPLVTGHALRHWGFRRLDKAGLSDKDMMMQGGWSKMSTMRTYLDEMRSSDSASDMMESTFEKLEISQPKTNLKIVK